ncbi:Stage III sporulation protein E [Sphingobacterium spiritivorum]|uniref:Stage III sporulation protein E n=1 Tax=Sphingobacterium spiritivorum TaxID=258 RepID=A0A380CCI5_SPHSI|nr:DNA translocase FtsK [Sphingobacterium spiritivorum]SUJ17845.1 Stage III sporulation protein E [Sphingobacterium spiritivorum]
MLNKGNTFKNYGGDNSSKKAPKSSSKSYNTKSYKDPSEPLQLSETQEKIMKILGVFLFILSFAFTIAFVSYLFTWEEDQSYISKSNGSWSTLFNTAEEIDSDAIDLPVVQNKLGKFGALLANQFIYEWFGIASFIFIFILFVTGYRLLYRKNILPVGKSLLYSSIAIIYVSVTLGFLQSFIAKTPHILEGKFGFWTNRLLEAQIGSAGVAGIVVFAYLTVLILIYNLDLKFTFQSKKKIYDEDLAFDTDDAENNPVSSPKNTRILKDEEYVIDPIDLNDKAPVQEFNQFREPEETYNNNARREEPTLSIEEEPEVVSNSTPHISFTIDHPGTDEEEVEEDIPASPVLRVEKVIEEKPITANDLVAQFGEYDPKLDLSGYQYPPLELLKDYGSGKITINQQELEANKNKIVDTLRNYSIEIEHIKATIGPTVTLYEIIPKPGVRISKIKNLEDDIALSLAALGIRIIAPMPGKGTIGIEVPNSTPEMVSMRSVLATEKFQKTDMDLPIALGKTISNEVYIADLAKMPHLLVAGATGQGKSVGINAILTSLLYKKHPAELKFVLVDPKKVELSLFKKIERHFLAKLPGEDDAIITDTKKVINTLNSLCIEMDQRYDLLKNGQVRNLKEYNAKFVNRRLNPEEGHRFLPFIVLIVDEFADLMMTAGKEVETPIARLAQLARAVGIHLVIATQRPSVNIITGTIKANFPARLAFRVLSKVDSRTILDSGGADQLIGRGDMLLSTGSDLIRIQCAFVDTPEVDQISDYIGGQRGYPSAFMLPEYVDENGEGSGLADFDMDDRDQLFEDAARLIVMHQQGSTSLIQRKLKLGYNRAGRIIDQLEAAGIVGPFEGSKAREVLYPDEYSLEQYLETLRKDN